LEGIEGRGVDVTLIDGDSRNVLKVPRLSPQQWKYVIEVLDSNDAEKVIHERRFWGTPTYTHVNSAIASKRGIQNFAIQVYHARETWNFARSKRPDVGRPGDVHKSFVLNPRFTEALMGYPRGWTEYRLISSVPTIS
jgi:hypothetical protein